MEENDIDALTSSNCTVFLGASDFGTSSIIRRNKIHNFLPVAAVVQISGFQFSGGGNTRFYENELYDFNGIAATSFIIGLNYAGNGTAVDTVKCHRQ